MIDIETLYKISKPVTDLKRFEIAQQSDYFTALEEVKQGRKISHWIWYVFPQLRGLGYSEMSDYYGIEDLKEASLYLCDAVLSDRLKTICYALLDHDNLTAEEIFGGVDAKKVQSCMTLFNIVSPGNVFEQVLIKFYDGKECETTKKLLKM